MAHAGLPGVAVCVDEAGQDDHAAGIDVFGILYRELRRDRGDAAILDQEIALAQVAHPGIDADDPALADDRAAGHARAPSSQRASSARTSPACCTEVPAQAM